MKTFAVIYARLNSSRKRYFLFALFSSLLVSVAQVILVGAIALLGATLSSPQTVVDAPRLKLLWHILPRDPWSHPQVFLLLVVFLCMVAVLVNNLLRLLNTYGGIRMEKEVEASFGDDLVHSYLMLPYAWHMNRNPADLATLGGWARFYGSVARNLINVSCDGLSVLMILAGLMLIDPLTSLGVFGVLGMVGFLLLHYTRKHVLRLGDEHSGFELARNRITHKIVHGIADIRMAGAEDDSRAEFAEYNKATARSGIRREILRSVPMYALESLGFMMIALTIWLLTLTGGIDARLAGTAALLVAAGWRLLPCMNKLLDSFGSLRTAWPCVMRAEQVFADMHGAGDTVPSQETGRSLPFNRSYQLEGIGFYYDKTERAALSGIDMTIEKGQAVGVVGRSGAGKSTLMNLLTGLLTESHGRRILDDAVLSAAEVRRWQVEHVGYVAQFPYIWDGSIAENIALGARGNAIDRSRVLRCCDMAALNFLDALPDGIDTRLGDRGLGLSGGQRQRLAIARALYKDPEMLVFDEATSSLDATVEREILDTIYALKGSMTLVIVSHRLATVESCDVVYWLENGTMRMAGAAEKVLAAYSEQ